MRKDTHRPSSVVLLAGSLALAAACRIYVDPPATSGTQTYATANGYPKAPRPRYVRRPAPEPASTLSATTTSTASTAGGGNTLALAGSPACLDGAVSAMPNCAQIQAAPGCTYSQQKCAAYKAYFDPKVAADAVSCLGTLGTSSCDANATNACGRSALGKACVDNALGQLCQIAASSCKTALADCESLLSGLNDDGKEKIAGCIGKGCTGGLTACVDAL